MKKILSKNILISIFMMLIMIGAGILPAPAFAAETLEGTVHINYVVRENNVFKEKIGTRGIIKNVTIKNNKGSAEAKLHYFSKRKFIGYRIDNGNVKIDNNLDVVKNLKSAKSDVKVSLDSKNIEKTITFVYEEKKENEVEVITHYVLMNGDGTFNEIERKTDTYSESKNITVKANSNKFKGYEKFGSSYYVSESEVLNDKKVKWAPLDKKAFKKYEIKIDINSKDDIHHVLFAFNDKIAESPKVYVRHVCEGEIIYSGTPIVYDNVFYYFAAIKKDETTKLYDVKLDDFNKMVKDNGLIDAMVKLYKQKWDTLDNRGNRVAGANTNVSLPTQHTSYSMYGFSNIEIGSSWEDSHEIVADSIPGFDKQFKINFDSFIKMLDLINEQRGNGIYITFNYSKGADIIVKHVDSMDNSIELFSNENKNFIPGDFENNTFYSKHKNDGTQIEDSEIEIKANIPHNGAYYKYEGEIEINPDTTEYYSDGNSNPTEAQRHTLHKDNITITKTASEKTTLLFKYQKYAPVEIKYLAVEDEHDLEGSLNTEKKCGEEFEIENTKKAINEYGYMNKWVIEHANGTIEKGNGAIAKTKNIDGKTTVKFYYNKNEANGFIYSHALLKTNYKSPAGLNTPKYEFKSESDAIKTIALDEVFEVETKLKDTDLASFDIDIKIEFPFDVFMIENLEATGSTVKILENAKAVENDGKGKFIKAGSSVLIGKIKKQDEDYEREPGFDGSFTFKNYFRLPSWVQERFTTKDKKLIKLEGEKDCYVIHEVMESAEEVLDSDGNVVLAKGYQLAKLPIYVNVIGSLYDFKVTNLTLDNKWKNALFASEREYNADLLPIGQNIAEPNYSKSGTGITNSANQPSDWHYGIMLGAKFYYSINTKGLNTNEINIEPRLKFYDTNGSLSSNNIYYKYTNINGAMADFAKSDGTIICQDAINTIIADSNRMASREVVAEYQKAVSLKNVDLPRATDDNSNFENAYKNYSPKNEKIGTFSNITLPVGMRLPYISYASTAPRYGEVHKIGRVYDDNGTVKEINIQEPETFLNYVVTKNGNTNNLINAVSINKSFGITGYKNNTITGKNILENEDMLINSLAHWYGEYGLPASLKVIDDKADEKKGFIVVEFKITSKDKDGNNYLTYTRDKNVSQWKLENTEIDNNKVKVNLPTASFGTLGVSDNNVVEIDISDGFYPVAIYQAGLNINSSIEIGVTH